jgi:hypothetical protein
VSRLAIAIAGAAMLLGGCAFVPQVNHRLEEVKLVHASALADDRISTLAPAQWARASEALDAAVQAWGTYQDCAVVDHLAYVARQRIEIARETARRVAAETVVETALKEREPARRVSLQR